MVLLIVISSLWNIATYFFDEVQFKKMTILPPLRELEIPGVMGFLKTKNLNKMYEA